VFAIKHKNIFFALSGLLVAASLVVMFMWSLPLGIDFTGGSVLEVSFSDNRPAITAVEAELSQLAIGDVSVRETGADGYIIRTRFLEESEREALVESLGGTVERFSSVGPTIGAELRNKALIAIVFVVTFIVLYVAFVMFSVGVSAFPCGIHVDVQSLLSVL